MPVRRPNLDAIRAELAWVTETPDPNKCGCRTVRCCEETGHRPGACVVLSKRSSGGFGGSTIVCHESGVAAKRRGIHDLVSFGSAAKERILSGLLSVLKIRRPPAPATASRRQQTEGSV